ncbi:MAG TPA: hypothetical protein VJG32_11510 [Anaerolineae bacterium]|nr:hypothetical protein [Anaerolineae bacterium]
MERHFPNSVSGLLQKFSIVGGCRRFRQVKVFLTLGKSREQGRSSSPKQVRQWQCVTAHEQHREHVKLGHYRIGAYVLANIQCSLSLAFVESYSVNNFPFVVLYVSIYILYVELHPLASGDKVAEGKVGNQLLEGLTLNERLKIAHGKVRGISTLYTPKDHPAHRVGVHQVT